MKNIIKCLEPHQPIVMVIIVLLTVAAVLATAGFTF